MFLVYEKVIIKVCIRYIFWVDVLHITFLFPLKHHAFKCRYVVFVAFLPQYQQKSFYLVILIEGSNECSYFNNTLTAIINYNNPL